MTHAIRERALEILRNYDGPGIMTMYEAVEQARREAEEKQ